MKKYVIILIILMVAVSQAAYAETPCTPKGCCKVVNKTINKTYVSEDKDRAFVGAGIDVPIYKFEDGYLDSFNFEYQNDWNNGESKYLFKVKVKKSLVDIVKGLLGK